MKTTGSSKVNILFAEIIFTGVFDYLVIVKQGLQHRLIRKLFKKSSPKIPEFK
jgi:hypothetical protein